MPASLDETILFADMLFHTRLNTTFIPVPSPPALLVYLPRLSMRLLVTTMSGACCCEPASFAASRYGSSYRQLKVHDCRHHGHAITRTGSSETTVFSITSAAD